MLVSLEMSMLIFFAKLEFPVYCDGPLSISLAIAKTRYTHYHKSRRHISTYPSHFNCPVRTVSPEELIFHAPYALSFPHSLRWSKPLIIIVSQPYGKLFLQRLWTPSTEPQPSLAWLSCLWAFMQFYFWLGNLHPGVRFNCWVSVKFLYFFTPRKGLGSSTTQSSRFKKNTMPYVLQVAENHQTTVPNMKKFTVMQQ